MKPRTVDSQARAHYDDARGTEHPMDDRKPRPRGPAWRAVEEFGCDMSLIEENLRLTPRERFRRHNEALRLIARLRRGMESQRG
jgi:hypothetical protein